MIDKRYTQRTVEWGHWGITFMDVQPDHTKNFGVIKGSVYFPVTNGMGPCDMPRAKWQAMCDEWVNSGILPPHSQE